MMIYKGYTVYGYIHIIMIYDRYNIYIYDIQVYDTVYRNDLRLHLDQELVSPDLHGLEGLGHREVVHQHTAVGAAVEGDAQGLEPLLPRGVPNLAT